MARLWAVVKREYLERVRSKWFVIATLFGPLFFLALILGLTWLSVRSALSVEPSRITILDATNSALGRRVADRLSGGLFGDSASARLVTVAPDALAAAEDSVTRAIIRREGSGVLVLGPDAMRDTIVRYAGRNATSVIEIQRIQRAMRDAVLQLRLEANGVDSRIVLSAMNVRMTVNPEQITDRGRGGSGRFQFLFAAMIAVMLYITILVHGRNVMRSVLEEKTTRVAEVVVASISPDTLLAGKVIGVGAVALTQVVTWIVASLVTVRFREPLMSALGLPAVSVELPTISASGLVLLVVFFVLGFVLFSALYAAAGAMVNSEQEAQQAEQPLMLVVLFPVVLIQPVLLNPGSHLAEVVSWLPFSAPVIMPLRLSLVPVSPQELLVSIAVNVVACAIALWLASRIYRVGILMYGKRATVREVARWIRQR
jgi:ABC-2 type transport system permease protein